MTSIIFLLVFYRFILFLCNLDYFEGKESSRGWKRQKATDFTKFISTYENENKYFIFITQRNHLAKLENFEVRLNSY